MPFSSVFNNFFSTSDSPAHGRRQNEISHNQVERNEIEKQFNWTQEEKKSRQLLILLNSFSKSIQWSFWSDCNYSTYHSRLFVPSEPLSQFVRKRERNKNLILPFYWVLIDFLLCDTNEIFSFSFSSHRFLVYLFSIKSKSWCCDWLNFFLRGDWSSTNETSKAILKRKGWNFCWVFNMLFCSSFFSLMLMRLWDLAEGRDYGVIIAVKWLIPLA